MTGAVAEVLGNNAFNARQVATDAFGKALGQQPGLWFVACW
jgi:hypothetical protein